MGLLSCRLALLNQPRNVRPITHIFITQAYDTVSNFQTCFFTAEPELMPLMTAGIWGTNRLPHSSALALYSYMNFSAAAKQSRKSLQGSAFPIQIGVLANCELLDRWRQLLHLQLEDQPTLRAFYLNLLNHWRGRKICWSINTHDIH